MANRPVVKYIEWQGIRIAIEYEYGSVNQKTTIEGSPVTHVFTMDYGFFPGCILSPGSGIPTDGEPLDAMISHSDPNSQDVFLVLQNGMNGQPSQVKAVLGTDRQGAIDLFMAHRPAEMFGGVYGSLSVTALRAAIADWKGTLPLEEKRTMRLPIIAPIPTNRGIMHMFVDAGISTESLGHEAKRSLDAMLEVEKRFTPTDYSRSAPEWVRKHERAVPNPSGRVRDEVRAIDEKARTIEFISSTSEIDRYDSIIEQDWRLENYRRNPIVLMNHNINHLPVGTTLPESLRTDRMGANDILLSTVQFLTVKENPIAEFVWQCYLSGAMRGISVRFDPESYTWEEREGRSICRYLKPELIEQSLCTVPGNASTLAIRDLQQRMIQALERSAPIIAPMRSYSTPNTTPTAAAPAAQNQTENKNMRLRCIAPAASVTHLLRYGDLEVDCPGCQKPLTVEVSSARDLEEQARSAKSATAEAKTRTAEVERSLSEATTRAIAAESKAAELERKIADLQEKLDKKTADETKARSDADAAIRRTAELELNPIVGVNIFEISPDEQRRMASLAVTDPENYAGMRDAAFAKFTKATGVDPTKLSVTNMRQAAAAGVPPVGQDPTPNFLRPPTTLQRSVGDIGTTTGATPPAPPTQGAFPQIHANLHGATPAASLFDQEVAKVV